MNHHFNDYDDDTESTDDSSFVETDQETISDDEDEIIVEEEEFEPEYLNAIYVAETDHIYGDRENDRYYIGCCRMTGQGYYLLNNSVSVNTFFQFPFSQITHYFEYMYFNSVIRPNIHVMKLKILADGTFSVIIKTHWLRLIQRRWKKIYAERMNIIHRRMSIESIKVFEMTGKFPLGMNYLPTIQGMLNNYSRNE
jgi:hypothetical protein